MTDLGSRRCPADAEAVSCGFRPVLDCLPQPVVPGRQSKCTDTPGPQHRYEAGCRLPVALFPVLGRDGLLAADKLRTRAFCPYGVLSRGGRPCALQFPCVSLRMPQLRARAARGRFRMAFRRRYAVSNTEGCIKVELRAVEGRPFLSGIKVRRL